MTIIELVLNHARSDAEVFSHSYLPDGLDDWEVYGWESATAEIHRQMSPDNHPVFARVAHVLWEAYRQELRAEMKRIAMVSGEQTVAA